MKRFPVPEVFLGMLAISVAAVLVAHTVAGTIHDSRHRTDTISVTGSARKPIEADLVQWALQVTSQGAEPAAQQAMRLRGEVSQVRSFLLRAGVPADAITAAVVTSETDTIRVDKHHTRTIHLVSQEVDVSTRDIDVVEKAAPHLGDLIEQGVDVSASPLQYLSTELTQAKLAELADATKEVRRRAEILIDGFGGKLGRLRSSDEGVFQIVPRDSTDVSGEGISDTSSRLKDVVATVTAVFAVKD
jgi:hypothetical protein